MTLPIGFQRDADGYWVRKDPDDTKLYTFDWSRWLDTGETIASAAWIVPAGLTKVSESNTTTACTVKLSGGTDGVTYTIVNRITTSAGQIADFAARVVLGDEVSQASEAAAPEYRRIAVLGDSITAFNATDTASERSFGAYGYLTWANILLEQRLDFRPEWNFGVSGDRLDQAYARISDVLDVAPAYCSVLCGTNDLAQDVSLATMQTQMQAIVTTLLAAQITPIVWTVLPRTGLTTVQRRRLLRFNTWVRDTWGVSRRVLVCDPFRRLADPASSTSDPASGMMQDGVHPAQTGAYWMGYELYLLLDPLLPRRAQHWAGNADTWDGTDNPTGNILSNAGFTSTASPGTGLSGLTAASWTASRVAGTGSATIAVQDRSDGIPGKEILLTINVTGQSSTEEWKVRQGVTAGTSFASGDEVYGQCELDVSNASNLKWCLLYLDDNNGSSVVQTARALASASNTLPSVTWSGALRTPEITVAAYAGSGTQSLSMGIDVAVNGSSAGSVTVKFRAPLLRKVA